jgi:hypothetical protein
MARAKWDSEPRWLDFNTALWHHLQDGVAISTPNVFLLARPVRKDAPYEQIDDPSHVFSREAADCWFIYAAASASPESIRQFIACEPFPLPYFGWYKHSRLRFVPRDKLISHVRPKTTQSPAAAEASRALAGG